MGVHQYFFFSVNYVLYHPLIHLFRFLVVRKSFFFESFFFKFMNGLDRKAYFEYGIIVDLSTQCLGTYSHKNVYLWTDSDSYSHNGLGLGLTILIYTIDYNFLTIIFTMGLTMVFIRTINEKLLIAIFTMGLLFAQ